MSDCDYPWIEIRDSDGLRGEDGWTIAECTRCGRDSFNNAPKYTEYWTHEHAEKCHPRWTVRKGRCRDCMHRAFEKGKDPDPYLYTWIIFDSHGNQYGCRQEFDEAIVYAQRKAAKFLRGELKWRGMS